MRWEAGNPDTDVVATEGPDGIELTGSAADGVVAVRIEVDLADAVGYWRPGIRTALALPSDWFGPEPTSLVTSAPIGVLYDAAGGALFGWAADESVRELSVLSGVSEEGKSFIVEVRGVRPLPKPLTLLLTGTTAPPADLAGTVRFLSDWVSVRCPGAPRTPPPAALLPVYSTWYTFTQDIDDALVRSEAALAADLGCGSVFIDDGWQRFGHGRGYQGCGDWLPDEEKFPDLRSTIDAVHDKGLAAALWIAPLLLGKESAAYARFESSQPHWSSSTNSCILDPRRPEVRTFVAQTCRRLVADFGVDILKIDFLDHAMVYADTPGASDVGEAMAVMLAEVRRALAAAGRDDVAFEFRQPYVSPALARAGEILRVSDCPADAHQNRLGSIDCRLITAGRVIHADPMMWGRAGGAIAVAQQLYAGWFAVPQISMRLSALNSAQAAALRGLLALWRNHAPVTLDGELSVAGAERGYDLVRAERRDIGRAVVARFAPLVVDVGDLAETTILNATFDDRPVVRASRPILGGVVRDASGVVIGAVAPSDATLIDLPVPSFGSVTLTA